MPDGKRVTLLDPLLTPSQRVPGSPSRVEASRAFPRTVRGRAPPKPVPGRLRVRCLGARDLRPFQVQIFSQGAVHSDPYAVLCLRRTERADAGGGHRMDAGAAFWTLRRCTHPVRKTRHPCWREEFWFSLPTSPDQSDYALEVTIYGVLQGRKQDEFLGYAELPIPPMDAEERKVEELQLGPSGSTGSTESEGRVRIELMWEPTTRRQTDTLMLFVFRSMNTVMGLRFFSIANLAIGGLLLLVAQGSRWLCAGDTFADCTNVEVPGARVAAVLGGMSAIASGVTNFLGTAGFFGNTWREGTPNGLLDEVQSGYLDWQDDRAPAGWASIKAPTLQLQVEQKHLFVWDVSVTAADLCPVKISMSSVRLLTWFGQGVALIMSSLSILLCWLDDSPHRFLGEGAWISFGALLMVLSSALLSGREACLSDPEEREEHWTTEDDAVDMRPRRVSFNTGPGPEPRGWSPARAVSGIEDFMTNFEEGVKAVKHEAENLQRPFLAAGEDLNARMKNFIQEMEQQVGCPSDVRLRQPSDSAKQ
ncbi:unnamed protein product [Durusdinium trenchii]|uniref:C2 domain-containing protein n=1 Tax=Durusdinium trenchii TaxID=1381693 RepID=A0ABP0I0Q2_9DINO